MTDLRASDADREQCVRALHRHAADGRLDTDELEERIGRAYAAKTVRQLADLQADLPGVTPSPALVSEPDLPRMPGSVPFTARWHAPTDLHGTMGELLASVAPTLGGHGYHLVDHGAAHLRFEWSHRPVWTILMAIFLFPIGLLALLYKRREGVAVDLVEERDGTRVTASGIAPLAIRRAFAKLED